MYRQNPVEWTSASPPLCFFTHSITVTPTTAVFYVYYVTTSLESSELSVGTGNTTLTYTDTSP